MPTEIHVHGCLCRHALTSHNRCYRLVQLHTILCRLPTQCQPKTQSRPVHHDILKE
jgi:hypothetical protein